MRWPHTVIFQVETEGHQDDGGGWVPGGWQDFLTTEAHVQPITGNQRFQAQQLETPINHKIYYPAQDGVKPNMRVKWLDRTDVDGNPKEINLQSDPIDQGGMGRVYMVEGVM